MLLIPRSYQNECVGALWQYFQTQTGNPICALPTGTGKSVIIAMFLESIYRQYPREKVLVLTHVKELIQQNYEKLAALWPMAPAGINSAGLGRRDTGQNIIFAGIGSVAKYWATFGHVDLVIIDEAHLVSPTDETMYQKFLAGLKSINPNLKVIGFTATPWRLGHGRITEGGSIFTDLCFDITGMEAFNRLIAEGYLCPLVPKKTETLLNVDGVHMRGHEFIASELQTAVDVDKITMAALKESLEMGHDRKKWLIFASGVKHAINISNMLSAMGIYCPAIHSDLNKHDRDRHILDYRAGRIQAVVNNNVLTTGLDVPDIDFIIMLRPTLSPVLWVQMLGRGTRPVYASGYDLMLFEQRMQAIREGGKENCLVADFAGNTKRLGPINDPVIPRKKGCKGGDAPIKLCDHCGSYNHASVRYCGGKPPPDVTPGYCGEEFAVAVKLKQSASTAELIKGEMPITEVFKIDHITYTQHDKHDKPPAMKVSYYCGLRVFEEYVCFEHDGYAQRKAKLWWRERSNNPVPEKTVDGLAQAPGVKVPTHINVWINRKYPDIIGHCYDGSAFGKQALMSNSQMPTIQVHQKRQARSPAAKEIHVPHGEIRPYNVDDDIPF